ncbi:hypothetical protein J6590_050082 [Homalodisca vitripennis]|nr:hypothetical protein J6590_050082 [Homalodisca vitripennis]
MKEYDNQVVFRSKKHVFCLPKGSYVYEKEATLSLSTMCVPTLIPRGISTFPTLDRPTLRSSDHIGLLQVSRDSTYIQARTTSLHDCKG